MMKPISIKEVLWCVLGSVRPYVGSYTELPSAVVKNATVAADNQYVMSGDIDIEKYAENLSLVSQLYGVEIKIFSEKEAWDNHKNLESAKFLWSSKTPRLWYGECFDQKLSSLNSPQPLDDMIPVLKKMASKKQAKSKRAAKI